MAVTVVVTGGGVIVVVMGDGVTVRVTVVGAPGGGADDSPA